MLVFVDMSPVFRNGPGDLYLRNVIGSAHVCLEADSSLQVRIIPPPNPRALLPDNFQTWP